jgi:hypothetical protein
LASANSRRLRLRFVFFMVSIPSARRRLAGEQFFVQI